MRVGEFIGPTGFYQNDLWTIHPRDNALTPGASPTTPVTPTTPTPTPTPTTPTTPGTPTVPSAPTGAWRDTLRNLPNLREEFKPLRDLITPQLDEWLATARSLIQQQLR